MYDLGKVCYLDLKKTGSSYIVNFLQQHISLDEVQYVKHRRISKESQRVNEEKFFFISVRDPLEQYKSLYSYGFDGHGALFNRLRTNGSDYARMYDGTSAGFSFWLEFLIDPQNYTHLGERYSEEFAQMYGFMTFRFLNLSFVAPMKKLATLDTREKIVEAYTNERLHDRIVRCETLNADLIELVKTDLAPYIDKPARAIRYLMNAQRRVNPSSRVDKDQGFEIENRLLEKVQEREWFLFDHVGYSRYV